MEARRKKVEEIKMEDKSKRESNGTYSTREKTKKIKVKQKKRKRLIIRNLSFQVTDEELKTTFSKFGNVVEVTIPVKEDGKRRGFAFVEYEDTKSLIKAMKALNYSEIHGRRVAIDYAIDKTSYQLKVQSIKQEKDSSLKKSIDKKSRSQSDDSGDELDSGEEKPVHSLINESDPEDESDKRVNEFLKEFDAGDEILINDEDDSSDEDSDNVSSESEENEQDSVINKNKKFKKSPDHSPDLSNNQRNTQDVSEGKTVFLRNVSFTTSKEGLKEAMEEYGECEYCVICMDTYTDHSKGTAFVKFKNKRSADKLIEEALNEPGVLVDGRKLTCSHAVSKEVISQGKDDLKKPKDKRNLNLLRVGLIMPNSEESEGVSNSDMAKRAQLEMTKRQKLRNVNFFVSDTRLMIHNLPKTLTDAGLRKLFKEAAGRGAIITEARVMKEFKKTNAQGIPLSKGFGFVCFSKHEDALKALLELNNNAKTFLSQKRPILEFSVENKVALLSKERRKEKMQMRNKKRSEEKREWQLSETTNKKKETSNAKGSPIKGKKRKKNNSKKEVNEKNIRDNNTTLTSEVGSPRKKGKKKNHERINERSYSRIQNESQISVEKHSDTKQKKKKQKPQRKRDNVKPGYSNQESFNNMVNKFKEKLLDKM